MTGRRRALASACAHYGRAATASALAHVGGWAGVSIRGNGHRAVATLADGTTRGVTGAELGCLVPLIPAHIDACPACDTLATAFGAWPAERFEALAIMLEPGTALD